jgi:4-carboxymuconolactone decarboxylase
MSSDHEKKSLGRDELKNKYHPEDVAELDRLTEFPDYMNMVVEFGLGDIWQRAGLSAREKELVVLSSLISQGDTERALRQHLYTSSQRQLPLEDILECVLLLSLYLGIPRTYNALEIIRSAREVRP